jgi:hypothetical protein
MNAQTGLRNIAPLRAFGAEAHAAIAAAYPNAPARFAHDLADHPLLSLEALAELAEALPDHLLEYNRSDLPIGIAPEDVPANGLAIGDTIRSIAENKSWAVLKNVETVPAYAALLSELLSELADVIAPRTGPMLTMQAYIFVSSPGSVTPFHFDPEHNILLHLNGTKTMTVYPAGDPRFAAQTEHERYHTGGHRNLPWREEFADAGFVAELTPGSAILVPVMAPHFVKVGHEPAISLSITWRSEWSYREAEAHAANHWLRQHGLSPAMPPRWPAYARGKTLVWRAARRLGIVQ